MDTASEEDRNQLRLLSLAHYACGVLALGFSLLFSAVIGFLLWMFTHPEQFSSRQPASPDWFQWTWGALSLGGLLFQWAHTAGIFVAGRFLANHRHRIFCIVVAAVNCMHFPFGLILGVLTIIVLCRPSVQKLFDQKRLATEAPLAPL